MIGFKTLRSDIGRSPSRAGLLPPVAVVIPAHNEERHIAGTLDPVCRVSDLLQITVVDDGSVDGTANIVRSYAARDARVRLLQLPVNVGKGGAMVAGAEASPCDLLAFLDADLVGLRPEHVSALIEPVRWGTCSMSVAVFTSGRLMTDWSQRLTPILNGQRCLRWSLFRAAPDLTTARWGAEVALSIHARQQGYRVATVAWRGVTHVMKPEKRGPLRGYQAYLRMYSEIIRYAVRHPAYKTHPRGGSPSGSGEKPLGPGYSRWPEPYETIRSVV